MSGLYRLLVVTLLVCGLSACSSTRDSGSTGEKTLSGGGRFKVGKPYQVDGVWYTPEWDESYNETGIASWYGIGDGFHGQQTANGEIFDTHALTAAHKTLPLPSIVRVTNLENGRAINLRLNDRGPFKPGRIIDVSKRAAELLGFDRKGMATVRVQYLPEESLAAMRAAGATQEQIALARGGERGGVGGSIVTASNRPQAVEARPLPTVPSAEPLEPVVASADEISPASGPASAPVQVAPPVSAPVGGQNIFIQAGAFSQEANATRLVSALRGIGSANVLPTTVNGRSLYRVRLGPAASLDQADTLLNQVVLAGYPDARIVVD